MPEVGVSSPARHFNVVVLPEPFGPRNPTTSPAPMEKLMASTAVTVRNRRLTTERIADRKPRSRSVTWNSRRSATTSIKGSIKGNNLQL
jgi:hypothetical protein